MSRACRSFVAALALAVSVCAFVASPRAADTLVFPGAAWDKIAPAQAGWSTAGLKAAEDSSRTIQTAAVMVVSGGRVVGEWGEPTRKFNVHSIRKSFLSAMYGIYVHEGRIDLSATLESLGIDDNEPSLTPIEKKATLHVLIEARSGVYHSALYETPGMKAARPQRGSHAPGMFWYYNNWDFNVLGTVFERLTKTNLFTAFETRIANPIGMEDYRIEDTEYVGGPDSVYPAYPFRMTARDMARFGLLFARSESVLGQDGDGFRVLLNLRRRRADTAARIAGLELRMLRGHLVERLEHAAQLLDLFDRERVVEELLLIGVSR